MARKPKPAPPSEPKPWSALDDVDYDEDGEGAGPMPDDDGNVVLRRSATQGGDKRGKGKDERRKPGRRR